VSIASDDVRLFIQIGESALRSFGNEAALAYQAAIVKFIFVTVYFHG